MPIYENYTIRLHYQEKLILVYFLMNSFASHGFSYFERKTNSLMLLSFSYHVLKKSIRKNSDVYKLTAKENLLVQYSKVFVIRKVLLLVILFCIYTKKTV